MILLQKVVFAIRKDADFKIKRQDLILILIIFGSSLLTRLWFSPFYEINPDSHFYIEAGENLMTGHGMNIQKYQVEGYSYRYYPLFPVYPALIGVIGRILGNYILASELISIVFGSLTAPIYYLLTFKLFEDKSAALIAGCLFAFYPEHIFYSGRALTEGLAIFLLLCSLYFLFDDKPFLSLLFLSTASLTRVACIFVIPAYVILLRHELRRKEVLIGFVVLAVSITGFLCYVRSATGSWLYLDPKSGYSLSASIGQTLGSNPLYAVLSYYNDSLQIALDHWTLLPVLAALTGSLLLLQRRFEESMFFLLCAVIMVPVAVVSGGLGRYYLLAFLSIPVFASYFFKRVNFKLKKKGFVMTVVLLCLFIFMSVNYIQTYLRSEKWDWKGYSLPCEVSANKEAVAWLKKNTYENDTILVNYPLFWKHYVGERSYFEAWDSGIDQLAKIKYVVCRNCDDAFLIRAGWKESNFTLGQDVVKITQVNSDFRLIESFVYESVSIYIYKNMNFS